ncbi:MAG: hypothetical protein GX197_03820 [Firmicutes bacterium]|nr:hypothetical protein [Bacillota bacterium]
MPKVELQSKENLKTANLLISLLLRFPEIFSIHLDMPNETFKFTFMLHGKLAAEEFSHFQKSMRDAFAAYSELTGKELEIEAGISHFSHLSMLTLLAKTKNLSLAEIQLCCGLVCNAFPQKVLRDLESLGDIQNEEILQQEEMIDYFLNQGIRTKKINLLAFRDAGKVFVYNK